MAHVAVGDMVRIADTAEYAEDVLAPMTYLEGLDARRHDSWENLLSGYTESSLPVPGSAVETKKCLREAGAELYHRDGLRDIHAYVKGPDYDVLREKYPDEHYKFYHSIVNKERGEEYVTAVIREAVKKGISLSIKTMEHAYDNPNLYTWNPKELAEIITQLQPLYADAFGETKHFLQGSVSGVNKKHVGWVQEPIRSGTGTMLSHSNRMGRIGEWLDRKGRSEEAYREGCAAAGVRPDAPWLLAGNTAMKSSDSPLGMSIKSIPGDEVRPVGEAEPARIEAHEAPPSMLRGTLLREKPGKLRVNIPSKDSRS